MIPYRRMLIAFLLAVLGYVGVSYLAFQMPTSAQAAEECGFLLDEFSGGGLSYSRPEAFAISFWRMQEYFTAATVGLGVAFAVFALQIGRRGQGAASAGLAAGGGLVAVSALCVSCLMPVLSVIGLGVVGTVLAGVPKWMLFLNMLLLVGWGTLFLTRRSMSCPRPAAA